MSPYSSLIRGRMGCSPAAALVVALALAPMARADDPSPYCAATSNGCPATTGTAGPDLINHLVFNTLDYSTNIGVPYPTGCYANIPPATATTTVNPGSMYSI